MGHRAGVACATTDEIAAMCALLDASLRDGAIGFGTSQQANHTDGDHEPVPSRAATTDELLQLATITGGRPGTTLEIAPPLGSEPFPDNVEALLIDMSLAADRPINWNILTYFSDLPDLPSQLLAVSDRAAERGACVAALFMPDFFRTSFNFKGGFRLEALPGWAHVFKLPVADRIKALHNPTLRAQLAAGAQRSDFNPRFVRWAEWTVSQTSAPGNAGLSGRKVGEIAQERGSSPFDTMLDIVCEDELTTSLSPPYDGDDDSAWRQRSKLAASPWTIVGGSDAGAHVEIMCQATYPTRALHEFSGRRLMEVEEIIRQLSDIPARYYGLRDRGRLAMGYYADIVVFDLAGVQPGPLVIRQDLPADGSRVFADALGIEHVIVNGLTIVERGQATGETPGAVMRAGRDTDTVSNAAARAVLQSPGEGHQP
jgi:N-acyl-D-aspartate/D-glutamate deacylase